jgi:hypothetical protein
MFETRQFKRMRQLFDDQFERSGTGYLYRKNMRSAAVQVSVEERDRFVAAFARTQRRATLALVVATVIAILLLALLVPGDNGRISDLATYGVVSGLIGLFALFWHWTWNAPVRALRGRTPVGLRRTRSETRRVILSRMTWGQLAIGYVAIGYGWWRVAAGHDLLSGWWRLWIAVGVALIGLAAWQAYQKWSVGGA